MPVSFRIDRLAGVVPCRSWGVITDWELTSYTRALRDNARFDPTFRQLVDLRSVESFDLTLDGVRELATLNPFACTSRRAAIVNSDFAFGMVRMYQSCLESAENFRVCRTLQDAVAWIGVDPATPWIETTGDWIEFDATKRTPTSIKAVSGAAGAPNG